MTTPKGQSFFSPITASHSKCGQNSAFFHCRTRETDDGKDKECGKFGKQVTKRIRIRKRQNISSNIYIISSNIYNWNHKTQSYTHTKQHQNVHDCFEKRHTWSKLSRWLTGSTLLSRSLFLFAYCHSPDKLFFLPHFITPTSFIRYWNTLGRDISNFICAVLQKYGTKSYRDRGHV